MRDQDKKSKDVLPENFSKLEEFSEFWDTHSTADTETLINLWLQDKLHASA